MPEPETLLPIDPERHALEMRIEHAKTRIVEDLNRASDLFRDVASRTSRGLGRVALISGVVVAGAILLMVARMRSRRRIRITWK